MRKLARAFLDALDDKQRAAAWDRFDVPDHQEWTYLPGERPGVKLGDLTPGQRELVVELIEAGCSERGAADTRDVLWTEAIRAGLPQTVAGSDVDEFEAHRYWVRILGDPDDDVWAWRINGHHLALHLTVVGDEVAATPQFFGAEPSLVLDGPHAGRRTLALEKDLGRELLLSFEPDRQTQAVISPVAPRDIQTRYDPVADPKRIQAGLAYGDMSEPQQQLLTRLMRQYVDRVTAQPARRSWQDIVDVGIERVTFSWAGGNEQGQGHYYAVAGPTFLIEYDNTQQNANHIHSVWRDLRHDWGADLLAEHYAAERHR